jgi:hypothetical protein
MPFALYLAQAAVPIAADVPPDLLAAGAGIAGAVGAGSVGGLVWRVVGTIVTEVRASMAKTEARVDAVEAALGELRADLRVAAAHAQGRDALIESAIKRIHEATR